MKAIVCDLKDLEVMHFLCKKKSKECELEIRVKNKPFLPPLIIKDRNIVFDLIAGLCYPSPAPYRRDVFRAFYDLDEPFATVLKDLIEASDNKVVTLWGMYVYHDTMPKIGAIRYYEIPSITMEDEAENHWMQSQVATLKERGYNTEITTNPYPNMSSEVATNRLCIKAEKHGDEILITQTWFKKSKKKRLAFSARIKVGEVEPKYTTHFDNGNVFVQPVKPIFLDGTFGSAEMNQFMNSFIAMENILIEGGGLKFPKLESRRIINSRRHPSLVGGKAKLFTIEYLDAKEALNYLTLFGGEEK